jgi:hypothetical protein
MIDLTILVCLYNKDLLTSSTIQSLLKAKSKSYITTVYIWDNSTLRLKQDSIDFLKNDFSKLVYKHTPENQPLSKIYNSVVNTLDSEHSYLMLCDDDSVIPESFFEILINRINLNPTVNLFLPKIYSKSILVSPAKDYLIRTKFIKDLQPGILLSGSTTAINSGMVISNRVFMDGFRYDENLRFYGTDNYFMNQYSINYRHLIVLDVEIFHSLSFNEVKDINNKIRIFREIKRANKIIYENHFLKRQLVLLNNLLVATKLSLKFKSFKFFHSFFFE